jgi:hypothetical protein
MRLRRSTVPLKKRIAPAGDTHETCAHQDYPRYVIVLLSRNTSTLRAVTEVRPSLLVVPLVAVCDGRVTHMRRTAESSLGLILWIEPARSVPHTGRTADFR